MAKISQYFKDKAKTIKDYPKTLMKAVYGDDGKRLDNIISDMNSTMNEFGEYKGISTVLSGTVSLKDTSLASGHYVCDSVINGPDDTRLTGGYIDVEAHPNSSYRKVKFSPYGINDWYVITCSGGTWSGWAKVSLDIVESVEFIPSFPAYKVGHTIEIYTHLSKLEKVTNIKLGNTQYKSVNKYTILPVYSIDSPYLIVGSLWIYGIGVVEIFKPSETTECYISGSYIFR